MATTVSASTALAQESAASRVEEGEQLGRDGKFREALAAFLRAEELEPRAAHDCYIAVAHMRLRQLTAARYFLDRCNRRSTGVTPVDWYGAAFTELAGKTEGYAQLNIEAPVAATARLTPDIAISVELPTALWLPPGEYVVRGMSVAGELLPVTATVASGSVSTVIFEPLASTGPVDPPRDTAMHPRLAPVAYGVFAIGAIGLGAGIFMHRRGLQASDRAALPLSQPDYDDAVSDIKRDRAIAVGLYSVSAAAIAVGVYLIVRSRDTSPVLTVSSDGDLHSVIYRASF